MIGVINQEIRVAKIDLERSAHVAELVAQSTDASGVISINPAM